MKNSSIYKVQSGRGSVLRRKLGNLPQVWKGSEMIVDGETVNVVYSYTPEGWSDSDFLASGGFVVVFLNYNKGDMVESAAKSALEQDYPMLEIFMMDDASTDGSGDVVERVARGYKGPHKVTVIRNLKNRSITGQWNVVSKMSVGNWFGMFCADDISFTNRVSTIATILKDYPDALGICTNALVAGMMRTFCRNQNRGTWAGEKGNLPPENFFGGMSFWNRKLFEEELPHSNLDDVMLQYRAMILAAKKSTVSLVWALDINTVTYSLGGLTNGDVYDRQKSKNKFHYLWLQASRRRKYHKMYRLKTWLCIVSYAESKLVDGPLMCEIKGMFRTVEMGAIGWLSRLCLAVSTLLGRKGRYAKRDAWVRNQVLAIFLMYFFGNFSYVLYMSLIEAKGNINSKKRQKELYGFCSRGRIYHEK